MRKMKLKNEGLGTRKKLPDDKLDSSKNSNKKKPAPKSSYE